MDFFDLLYRPTISSLYNLKSCNNLNGGQNVPSLRMINKSNISIIGKDYDIGRLCCTNQIICDDV